MIQVPIYTPKIPIRGGGGIGHIDLRERAGTNPIVEALSEIGQKISQDKQDALNRRQAEANIAYRQKATEQLGQPGTSAVRIVTGGGKTWLANLQTGEKRDLGIPAPKSQASAALLNAWLKLGQYKEPTPEEEAIKGSLGQQLLGQQGLEKGEGGEISPTFETARQKATLPGRARQYYPGGIVFPPSGRPQYSLRKTVKSRKLDETTARAILKEAGGDKEKARQIAKQRGYVF